MNFHEPNMAQIRWYDVVKSLLILLVHSGLTAFYTYSLMILPNQFKLKPMSVWFGILIALYWINTIPLIDKLCIMIKHFGTSIEDNILNALITPRKRYKFTSFVSGCIELYFFIVINPFSGKCGIYTESGTELACISVQLISWIMFLYLCTLALTILGFGFLMLVICCMYYRRRSSYDQNPPRYLSNPEEDRPPPGLFDHPIMVSATQFLERYVPIEPPTEDKCFICLETTEEDSDKEWTMLSCGHRSHRLCLADWYRYEQSCPVCRQAIEVGSVASSV